MQPHRFRTTIQSPAEISPALESAEQALSSGERRESATLSVLIAEEILKKLPWDGTLKAVLTVGGIHSPFLEIRCPASAAASGTAATAGTSGTSGTPTAAGTPASETAAAGTSGSPAASPSAEAAQLESEISESLLSQFDAYIDRQTRKGTEIWRIRMDRRTHPDMTDEIFAFYEHAGERQRQQPLSLFAELSKHHPAMVSLSMLNKIVKHLCALMLPVFAANVIDSLSSCASFWDAPVLLNILFSILSLTINLICATLDNTYYQRFTRCVESGLKMAMVQKLQALSLRYYQKTPTGRVLSKLVSDIQFIKLLINEQMTFVLHLGVDLVFAVVLCLIRMPLMLIFYAVMVPLSVLLIRHYSVPIQLSKAQMRRRTETSNAAFSEMLSMMSLTRSHSLQRNEYNDLSAKVWEVQTAAKYQDLLQIRLNNVGYGVAQGFRILCLAFAVFLAFRGIIGVSAVVLFLSLYDALINSIQKVLDTMPQITQGLDSLKSVNEIMFEKDVEKNGTRMLPAPVRGEIELDHVSFAYEENREGCLRDVSLKVPAGTSAALIGKSGSGKSTLLNLVLGLYSPQSGRILIDGVDLDELDKRSFRRHVAVVPQMPMLFSGTLWDNLVYGLKYVSVDQVLSALESVGLGALAKEHPDGLLRPVAEGGLNFSGGQRQRIAIARALLRQPRILIFDEATNALDREAEQEVQEAINAVLGTCTILIVAHRLYTLKNVDQVWRIENRGLTPVNPSTLIDETPL